MILTRVLSIGLIFFLIVRSSNAGDRKKLDFRRDSAFGWSADAASWAKRYKQGCSMKVWLNNALSMGYSAWLSPWSYSVPPSEPCSHLGIGMDYPDGGCIEHVFGAAPFIGGIVDGVRRVSAADYEWWLEFLPEPRDSMRDRIWRTSTLYPLLDLNFDPPHLLMQSVNTRGFDDDHDGKIDEDDLDGLDNDGDWNPLTDDVGADGLPDFLETGCDGRTYDPVTNSDPAYDNYDPTQQDICRVLPNGSQPYKDDKNIYTEKNGIPDHGEPHVDEDYGAFSESDVYISATDTCHAVDTISHHVPMGIKITQRSYSWCGAFTEGVLPMDYWFINIGKNVVKDVFLGFWTDMDVGPVNAPDYPNHNYAGFWPELRTGYVHNPMDAGSTPAGIIILAPPRPWENIRFTAQWYGAHNLPYFLDTLLYRWISCENFGYQECIAPDGSPGNLDDVRLFFSLGPITTLNPGDTLKMTIALIAGDVLDLGRNSLRGNAAKALRLYQRGYLPPATFPAIPVRLTEGFRKVKIEWGRHVCPTCPDPTKVWDDSNRIAESDPLRSADPPSGRTRGGRIFEGYRLYRSEDPGFSPPASTFSLLKQYDVAGDGFAYNAGIDTAYIDSNLVRGKRYWYAVTAFGIPEVTIINSPDIAGNIRTDTLYSEYPEQTVTSGAKSVVLPFSVSNRLGDVLVVPNPYRVDRDYTYESGGWEGRASDWSENKRLLKFIHLPPKCTVRIFTLAGDLVATLEHDDPMRGELTWDLLSESNRAIASGVYVFTVESDLGRQIGKFVIIR